MGRRPLAGALLAGLLSACSAGGSVPHAAAPIPAMPASKSPASFPVAPMVRTAVRPASEMTGKTPSLATAPLNWTQVPGSASVVSASQDGSLWALSSGPDGTDKPIWHDVDGTWTNIPGMATQIAAAPNGTLYAVNAAGGTYAYTSGTWTSLGGGAVAVAAGSDGTAYVLSNDGQTDHAIWHYNGGWQQLPGSATGIEGAGDGGLYVTNSIGSIYYESPTGAVTQLPGSAAAVAPTYGGLFALGYPANAGGNPIYYYDDDTSSWSSQPGSGVAASDATGYLYVLSANGAIYGTQSAPWTCDNAGFLSLQSQFSHGTITADQFVDICGVVTQVLAEKHTSSGNHGYYYIRMPGGYNIEIVCNLDAMGSNGTSKPPTTWPWVKVGDYSYVQGRYYYDNANSQGVDWTEHDQSQSWPHYGYAVVNGNFYD